jgi:hypothetical protein
MELFDAAASKPAAFRAVVEREWLGGEGMPGVNRFADGREALGERACGNGRVVRAAFRAGLTYSATVRRADFDMTRDFAAPLREAVAAGARRAGVTPPVFAYDHPLVETILLEKDGKQCIALMNWAYRAGADAAGVPGRAFVPAEGVRINLDGVGPFKGVRSLRQGELGVTGVGGSRVVRLAKLEEIDLLVLE